LRDPNKPFNIGSQVAEQATSKQSLRDIWKRDPKAKQDLSPIELIKFDKFMKDTKKRCTAIHGTPVMIVQGMADQLVKPRGTYEMFDNVRSKDKTMLIIGSAEHLIFETPKQSKVLLDGLASWLNDHVATDKK
jgi:lysophospholipase